MTTLRQDLLHLSVKKEVRCADYENMESMNHLEALEDVPSRYGLSRFLTFIALCRFSVRALCTMG